MNADIYHKIDLNHLPQEVEAAHLIGVPNPEHNLDGDFNLAKDIVQINQGSNDLTWSGISVMNPSIFKENNFKIIILICGTLYFQVILIVTCNSRFFGCGWMLAHQNV